MPIHPIHDDIKRFDTGPADQCGSGSKQSEPVITERELAKAINHLGFDAALGQADHAVARLLVATAMDARLAVGGAKGEPSRGEVGAWKPSDGYIDAKGDHVAICNPDDRAPGNPHRAGMDDCP